MKDDFETKAYVPSRSPLPIGTIQAYGGNISADWERQSGWLVCDGRSVPKASYRELFDAIGTCWGGDGSDNFNLPDLRGLFLRGVASGSANDPDARNRTPIQPGGNPGDRVGSYQPDELSSHAHTGEASIQDSRGTFCSTPRNVGIPATFTPSESPNAPYSDGGASGMNRFTPNVLVGIKPSGGNETRSKNAAVVWVICYR
jgi:microcystin-dependent protein